MRTEILGIIQHHLRPLVECVDRGGMYYYVIVCNSMYVTIPAISDMWYERKLRSTQLASSACVFCPARLVTLETGGETRLVIK